jgi:hypothetical protein
MPTLSVANSTDRDEWIYSIPRAFVQSQEPQGGTFRALCHHHSPQPRIRTRDHSCHSPPSPSAAHDPPIFPKPSQFLPNHQGFDRRLRNELVLQTADKRLSIQLIPPLVTDGERQINSSGEGRIGGHWTWAQLRPSSLMKPHYRFPSDSDSLVD